jgi:hypothetical protein
MPIAQLPARASQGSTARQRLWFFHWPKFSNCGGPARYFYFADHKIVTPYASFDALNNQQNQVERQLNMDESP